MGSDHKGFRLKQALAEHFASTELVVNDLGTMSGDAPVDYPDYAGRVCEHVVKNDGCFGVLVCHSGIGMTMAANRFCGIRAAWCDKTELAILSRTHNHANVICLGSLFVDTKSAISLVDAFMRTIPDCDERHHHRIRKIEPCFLL
jgi:ribose 5-phosphate isomerase B